VSPKRWDLYVVDSCPLGGVEYARPCIIAKGPQRGKVTVIPTSSEMDLYLERIEQHFVLSRWMDGFLQTSLDVCSYVINDYPREVPVSALKRPIGRLRADLARAVPHWLKHGYNQDVVWTQIMLGR